VTDVTDSSVYILTGGGERGRRRRKIGILWGKKKEEGEGERPVLG
jgi:hypothetical protein